MVLEFAFFEQIAKFGVVSRFIFLRLGIIHVRTPLTVSITDSISQSATVCVSNGLIDGRFAAYLFKYPPLIHLFYRYSQGLVDDTLALKFSNFAQIKVTIPPLAEQEWISCILQNADRQIDLLKSQLTCLQPQKRELINRLLTGQLRKPAVSAGQRSTPVHLDDGHSIRFGRAANTPQR
jgi:restriction endonuclease S subunit